MMKTKHKWHVGQHVIVFHGGHRSPYIVTKVGRRWITARENSQYWPREYRFDAETREHEDAFAGRIALNEADINELIIVDGVRDARENLIKQIQAAMYNGRYAYSKRLDKQPREVLNIFEAALRAAGWWKE